MSDDIRDHDTAAPRAHGDRRDPDTGRLLPGHAINKGRESPDARKAAEWRHSFRAAVTPQDIGAVVLKLVEAAKAGEAWAVRDLLDRTVGPANKLDLNVGGGGTFQILVVPAEDGQRITNALPDDGANPSMQGTCGQNDSTAESVVSPTQPQNRPYQAEEGGEDGR